MIFLCPVLQEKFSSADAFEQILAMDGKIYRDFRGRKTLRFEHIGKGYFLKIHPGVGWLEVLKSLLLFKTPVLSAKDEYDAIRRLENIGVQTMKIAGFGLRGSNPARLQSFIITEEIEEAISLEELDLEWRNNPPDPRIKRVLIRKVAEIARIMHQNGVNHRDFYICHFLLENNWRANNDYEVEPPLHVIDLHRSQLRTSLPKRWRLKDLASLHFSSMDAGLTKRDRFRFMACYEKKSVRNTLKNLSPMWAKIDRKAVKLYKKLSRGKVE
jgi:heptose I phosphotransferase